jgi:hypothetical protein
VIVFLPPGKQVCIPVCTNIYTVIATFGKATADGHPIYGRHGAANGKNFLGAAVQTRDGL